MYKIGLLGWALCLALAIVFFYKGEMFYGIILLAQSLISLLLYKVNKPIKA